VRKYLFLITLSLFAGNILFAQDDDLPPPTSKPKDAPQSTQPSSPQGNDQDFQGFTKQKKKIDLSKFIIEPDFYFSIGDDEIDLGLSPLVGYEVYKNLFVGGSLTYLYTGFRNVALPDPRTGGTFYANLNWHTFGGGPMVQYNIWKGFFARAHFELLHRIMDDPNGTITVVPNFQNNTYSIQIPKVQATIPDLLIGVGYNLLRSKNFFFPIMVSYNVLYSATNQTYAIYPHGWVVQLGFVDIF
jgi:hypothetical protein